MYCSSVEKNIEIITKPLIMENNELYNESFTFDLFLLDFFVGLLENFFVI